MVLGKKCLVVVSRKSQAKLKSVLFISILFVSIFGVFLVVADEPELENLVRDYDGKLINKNESYVYKRTSETEIIKNPDGTYTRTIGQGGMFIDDKTRRFPNYVPVNSIVKLNKTLNPTNGKSTEEILELTLRDSNMNLTFVGTNPAGQEIPTQSANGIEVIINNTGNGYKWGYRLRLPNTKFKARIYVNSDKDFTYDEFYIYQDDMVLSFDDVLEYNYTRTLHVQDNKTAYYEITKDYQKHGIKNNDWIWIDPTVQLQDADTENLKDARVVNTNPGTGDVNYGTLTFLAVGLDNVGADSRAYISFDMTQIPSLQSITFANFNLYAFQLGISAEPTQVHHVYTDWKNGTGDNFLNETQITDNNQPCGTTFTNSTNCNLTFEENITVDSVGWWGWNVTNAVSKANDDNTNISLAVTFIFHAGSLSGANYYSKEYTADTSLRPYLNITYTPYIDIISPTPAQIFTEDASTAELNISTAVAMDTCYWTDDSGTTNYTMSSVNTTYFYNNTAGSVLLDGSHTLEFYCNESSDGTWRTSDSVSFDVDSVNITTCRDLAVFDRTYQLLNDLDKSNQEAGSYGECLNTKTKLSIEGNGYIISNYTKGIYLFWSRSYIINNITLENNTNGIFWDDTNFPANTPIISNTIFKSGNTYGFYQAYPTGNFNFINNNINSTIKFDMRLNSLNNYIIDSNFYEYGNITSTGGSNGGNVYIINTTYANNNVENLNSPDNLTRKWYFSPQVNYTHNGTAVSGANVTAYNVLGVPQFSLLTDSNGQIAQQELIEYINTGGTKTYYTSYTFNVTYPNFDTDSQSINLTTNYYNQQFNMAYSSYVDIISPTASQTFTEDAPTAELNISTAVAMDICYWTNDSGTTNYTMSSVNTTYFYNNTAGSVLLDGSHTLEFYCNESVLGTWYSSDSVSFNIDSINITTCRDLTVGRSYKIINDINQSSGSCLTINNSNTEVDCQGNIINYSQTGNGYGIYASTGGSGYNNLTIKNCIFEQENYAELSSSSTGIYLSTTISTGRISNSSIINNTFNILKNNNSMTCGSYCFGWGILMRYTIDSIIENNTINIYNGNYTRGIELDEGPINLDGNNNITNNIFNHLNNIKGDSIFINIDTNNNFLKDNNFNGGSIDIKLIDAINIIILNNTYSTESVDASSTLTRKWYFSPQVNFTHNGTAVSGANVTAYNVSGVAIFSELTDANGQISRWELIEYINNGGTKTYYTNYTINVTLSNWDTNSQSINLTTNYLNQQFNISDTTTPVTTISMTSPPDGASYTNDTWSASNIKATMITTDAAGFDDTAYPSYCTDTTNTCAPNTFISSGVTVSTEGISYIRYNSTDYVGNVEATQTRTLKIDTTPPNITITTPVNNTNSSDTTLDINFTVTDISSGVDSCWYSNGTLTSNITLTNCANITTAVWAEGQHSVTIWVNDSVNNINSTSVTFTIDTILPVTTISYPLNQSYSINISDLNYTFTEINCESAWYSLNNGITNSSASSCSTNWTDLTSNEGSNRWTVYINDSANNQNSTSVTFHKDTVYPQISIATPSNYTNTTDTTLDVNYTATDTNIDSCWWTNDSGANNNSLTNCNTNITTAVWTDSIITVKIYVNDTVNNVNWTSVIFTVDSTNPIANLTYPLNNTYNSSLIQNFTFNVSDNLGVSSATLYIWNTTGEYNSTNTAFASGILEDTVGIVTTLVEGIYNWWVQVWDWAGNTFTTGNQTIIIDTMKPNISFESSTDANATYKQTGDILINVSVVDTNLDSVQFSWNNVNETFANSGDGYYWENKTSLSEGTYNFYAWINDSANNYNETVTRTVYIDLNDPSIALTHPTPSSYNYNTSISLNYTVSDLNLDTCWYNLDGATNTTLSSCANLTNGFNTSEAVHTLFLYANDSSGRIGSDTVTFSVSLAPPSVILNYPTDDLWLNYKLNIDFNFTPTDVGGIDTCEIWGNWTGTWHKNTTLIAPPTGVINSTTLNLIDGNGYSWNVWCNDTGNNAVWGNPTSNNTFNVDSIYPLISYGEITAGDFANLSQSSIYVNLSLTELNIKLINFTLKNDTAIVNSTSFSTVTYTINWTNLIDANYSYYVNITDSADNVNSTVIRYITLDDTIPVANLIYPKNNTHNATLTQNITYNVSDNLGVSNSTLYIWNTTGEYNSTNTTFASNIIEDTVGIVMTFTEGIYNWWVQVWDWAGNTFTTGNKTFTIDATFPVIDYNGGTQDDETNTTSTEIYINVSVTEDHEETIVFRIHNSTGSYNTTLYSDARRNINLTNVRDGVYTYNVTINDSSGQTSNTSTRTIRLDDTPPELTIKNPLAQNYGTNNSMFLNYTATDNVVGLDECWYYILNSTLSIVKSTETLLTCQNDSFTLPGGDIDYTLRLFAKDLLSNTQSTTITFGIRTISPVIVLTTANDTHSNNETVGNYFNFTVETSADSISNCSLYGNWTGWHLNETISSPSEATDTNFEPVNLSEGEYFWNVECIDNLGNNGFALNNNTYIVDLTNPGINITTITTTAGFQTFNFNTTVTDTYLPTTTCKYSIFNSTGGIDGVENISTTCNVQAAGTTFAFATYNLTVYATDKAGNENSFTKGFTTTTVPPGAPGGGAPSVEIVEVFIEPKGICGDGFCEPDFGENFLGCPQDCGGINADDLLLSCFSEDPDISQKCITKQAPVLFWTAMLLVAITAIAMITRIPAVRRRLPKKIFKVPEEKTKRPIKKKPSLARSWLKNQQNFIRKWRNR